MKIHFIGIGGIGVSALARYYLAQNHKVSGSDLVSSEITKALKKLGAKVFIGKHKAKNLPKDADLIIYSSAILEDNPELLKAKKLQATSYKLRVMSYPKALGDLTKKYFTIAICGMHGKTTTTALLSLILAKAGLDPTVIVGTKLKEFKDSNCRIGEGKYLVIEADEYKSAFLNYWPKIIILTSIEREHLDYYKNLEHILRVFREFIMHLPRDGVLVANKGDKNIKKLIEKFKNQKSRFKIVFYSLSQKQSRKIRKTLRIPGDFNVSNALAALIVARILKIPDKITFKTFSEYKGSWRRFEIFNIKFPIANRQLPITLISDYAHHPTQVKVTIRATREKFPKRRIVLVYQPHQVKRTKILFEDFVKSFDGVDLLILNEIYEVAGRETEGKRKISSRDLALSIQRRWEKLGYRKIVRFIKNQDGIFKKLKGIIKKNDIVIVMGAGDIYNLVLKLRKVSTS